MANRAHLYSMNIRPSSPDDVPETVSGISEYPWHVPFSYRVLASGDPQRCTSLIADSIDDEPVNLYAVSGDFDAGFARFRKLYYAVLGLVGESAPVLVEQFEQGIQFLEEHRDRYVHLETIELDCLHEGSEEGLRALVDEEVTRCRQVGQAIDALPDDIREAAKIVAAGAEGSLPSPSVFEGLVFTDEYDHRWYDCPLGLYWSSILYFRILSREELAARTAD